MTTDTETYEFKRTLALPPAQIWELVTDAKHRENWGVPDPSMVLEVVTADLKVGGIEHHRCGPADNPEFEVETRWYDLAGPDRAVFTETLIFGGAPVATSLVTYALVDASGKTDFHVTVAASSFSGHETLGEMNAGWHGGLDTLEAYAKSIKEPV